MDDGLWLPDESIYLEKQDQPSVRPHRPWNQGDIFENVALAVLDKPKKDREPKDLTKVRTGMAAMLGNPCSVRAGGRVVVLQNLAQVRRAKEKEVDRFAEYADAGRAWDGSYQLFPLPALREESLYVVDFNVVGTVHFKHLEAKRIACLSHAGWTALQIRYAWHSLRIKPTYAARFFDLKRTWDELAIWEEWCRRGYEEEGFAAWLREPLGGASQYSGTRRSDLLDLAPDFVRDDLPLGPE